MVFAGIKVPDTTLVRDAMELARGLLEPFLFNHVMRSWLFGVVLSEDAEHAPDPELLAVAAVLHDLGLTDRYTGANRFEVDGANAARVFLSDHGISAHQMQLVWDAIALHTTPYSRAPQRTRGRHGSLRHRGRRSRSGPRSNPAGQTACDPG